MQQQVNNMDAYKHLSLKKTYSANDVMKSSSSSFQQSAGIRPRYKSLSAKELFCGFNSTSKKNAKKFVNQSKGYGSYSNLFDSKSYGQMVSKQEKKPTTKK